MMHNCRINLNLELEIPSGRRCAPLGCLPRATHSWGMALWRLKKPMPTTQRACNGSCLPRRPCRR